MCLEPESLNFEKERRGTFEGRSETPGDFKTQNIGVGRPLYFRILNFEFHHRTLFIPLFLNLSPLGPKPLEEGSADPHLGCSAAQL